MSEPFHPTLYVLFVLLVWLPLGHAQDDLVSTVRPTESSIVLGDAVTAEDWSPQSLIGPAAPAIRSESSSIATSDFSIDTADRLSTMIAYHRYYGASNDADSVMGWAGNLSTCDAGALSNTYQEAVLRRINYFRAQAGVSSDIVFDAAKNQASQEAALTMVRQKALSHTPFADFVGNPCVTQEMDVTASSANLALGSYGPYSIDRLMMDDGSNNGPVGHRRWFLYPSAQEMGHGSVPFIQDYTSACVVWVIGEFRPNKPAAKSVPWPNEGYCPHPFVPGNGQTHPRWSFSYPQADFSQAQISMTYEGTNLSIVKEPFQGFTGDNTLVWRPSGIPADPPAAGTNPLVHVHITGIQSAPITEYAYNVRIFDPFDLQETLTVNGPADPAVGGGSLYAFNSITRAEGYRLRIAEQTQEAWLEGAENSPTPNVVDETSDSYSLRTTALSATGSRSFQMLFPTQQEQIFEIDRSVIPATGSVLEFKRLFRFFYVNSRFKAEVSGDEGGTWTTLFDRAGYNTGSSVQWDKNFISESVAIPEDYHGSPIRVRFRIHTNGSYFQFTGGNVSHFGVFIDDVAITNTSQITNEQLTSLEADSKSFVFNASTVGSEPSLNSDYLIQLAPIVGTYQFPYTVPMVVRPIEKTVNEADNWYMQHFGTTEPTEETAPAGDYDGDGLSNLLERALGSNPVDSSGTALPSGDLPASGSLAGRPVLCFSVPAAAHGDITYEVQDSSDLSFWRVIARKVGSGAWTAVEAGASMEIGEPEGGIVSVKVASPPTGVGEHKHLRLVVSSAE